MDNAYMLIGLAAVIWVVFILLRAPATILFFALLVGQQMGQQLGDDAFELINKYATLSDIRYVYVGLLLSPVVLTLVFLRGRVGKSKRIIEAVPLLFAAASIIIFVDSYLAVSQNLSADQTTLLRTYEGVVVSVGAVLSLVSSWLSYPSAHKDKKKHKML